MRIWTDVRGLSFQSEPKIIVSGGFAFSSKTRASRAPLTSRIITTIAETLARRRTVDRAVMSSGLKCAARLHIVVDQASIWSLFKEGSFTVQRYRTDRARKSSVSSSSLFETSFARARARVNYPHDSSIEYFRSLICNAEKAEDHSRERENHGIEIWN